jgi:hypothetical protein
MTYQDAKARKLALDASVKAASDVMHTFPSLPNGLTPDDVKRSPEYRLALSAYEAAFAAQRQFNSYFLSKFKREYKAERRARIAILTA